MFLSLDSPEHMLEQNDLRCPTKCLSRYALVLVALLLAVLASACSNSSNRALEGHVLGGDALNQLQDGRLSANWAKDGSISVARPLPKPLNVQPRLLDSIFGFLPTFSSETRSGRWLQVNIAEKNISVMEGETTRLVIAGEGFESLSSQIILSERDDVHLSKRGTSSKDDELVFQVLHKQEDPLWYAPDNYFSARKLPLPNRNSRERFRRGALGLKALFIRRDLPIHSGPFWSKEIGGLRVSEGDMRALYSEIEVGLPVSIHLDASTGGTAGEPTS